MIVRCKNCRIVIGVNWRGYFAVSLFYNSGGIGLWHKQTMIIARNFFLRWNGYLQLPSVILADCNLVWHILIIKIPKHSVRLMGHKKHRKNLTRSRKLCTRLSARLTWWCVTGLISGY